MDNSFSDLLDNTIRRHRVRSDYDMFDAESEEYEETSDNTQPTEDSEIDHHSPLAQQINLWMMRVLLFLEVAYMLNLATAFVCPVLTESEAPMRYLTLTPLIEVGQCRGVAYDVETATLRLHDAVMEPMLLCLIPIALALLALLLRYGYAIQRILCLGSLLLFVLIVFLL